MRAVAGLQVRRDPLGGRGCEPEAASATSTCSALRATRRSARFASTERSPLPVTMGGVFKFD